MSITYWQIFVYMGGLAVLVITPGPVWVALMARAMHTGFAGAWPLALGVMIGDLFWSLLAILGVSWIASELGFIMALMRWVACGMFLFMGARLIYKSSQKLDETARLARPGIWPGFTAGIVSILGNPKAVLFYMGVLPGFFDLSQVTKIDIAVIVCVSALVPFCSNIVLSLFIHRLRTRMFSAHRIETINKTAGVLMIFVGVIIALPI